jgi:hypothetical protein
MPLRKSPQEACTPQHGLCYTVEEKHCHLRGEPGGMPPEFALRGIGSKKRAVPKMPARKIPRGGFLMFTLVLYAAAGGFLLLSAAKSKAKNNRLPQESLEILREYPPAIFSHHPDDRLMMSVLDKATISALLGKESGALGMAIAAVIGSITLIPGFVAFPLAASLLSAGAGYGQLTLFVSTLMMVGILTLPTESRYFGKKISIKRNLLAFFLLRDRSVILGGILS